MEERDKIGCSAAVLSPTETRPVEGDRKPGVRVGVDGADGTNPFRAGEANVSGEYIGEPGGKTLESPMDSGESYWRMLDPWRIPRPDEAKLLTSFDAGLWLNDCSVPSERGGADGPSCESHSCDRDEVPSLDVPESNGLAWAGSISLCRQVPPSDSSCETFRLLGLASARSSTKSWA